MQLDKGNIVRDFTVPFIPGEISMKKGSESDVGACLPHRGKVAAKQTDEELPEGILYARTKSDPSIPSPQSASLTAPPPRYAGEGAIPTIRVRALFDVLTAEFFFGDGEVYLPLKPDDPDRPEGIFVSCDKEAWIKVASIERTMG